MPWVLLGHLVRPWSAPAPDRRRSRRGPCRRAQHQLDMPLSTVYRYLRTLGDFGFVDRNGGLFRIGPKLLIGTGANVSSERLIRHADAALRMLVQETGETAIVVRRIGLSSRLPPPGRKRRAAAGDRASRATMSPLYAGAPGRVAAGVRAARGPRRGPRPGPRSHHRRHADRGGAAGRPWRDRDDRDGDRARASSSRVPSRWRRRSSARTGSSGRSGCSDRRSAATKRGARGPDGSSRGRRRTINAALAEDRYHRLVLLSRYRGRPSSHGMVIRCRCSLCCIDMSHRSPSPLRSSASRSRTGMRRCLWPTRSPGMPAPTEVEPGEWYMVAFRSVAAAGCRRGSPDGTTTTGPTPRRWARRVSSTTSRVRPSRTATACRSACGTAGPRHALPRAGRRIPRRRHSRMRPTRSTPSSSTA